MEPAARSLEGDSETQATLRTCLGAAVLVTVPLALFLLAFVVIFAEGPRQRVADDILGCDGPVVTEESGPDDPEPTVSFSCEKDGRTTTIDLQLALVGFAPFLVVVVLPAATWAAIWWLRRRQQLGPRA